MIADMTLSHQGKDRVARSRRAWGSLHLAQKLPAGREAGDMPGAVLLGAAHFAGNCGLPLSSLRRFHFGTSVAAGRRSRSESDLPSYFLRCCSGRSDLSPWLCMCLVHMYNWDVRSSKSLCRPGCGPFSFYLAIGPVGTVHIPTSQVPARSYHEQVHILLQAGDGRATWGDTGHAPGWRVYRLRLLQGALSAGTWSNYGVHKSSTSRYYVGKYGTWWMLVIIIPLEPATSVCASQATLPPPPTLVEAHVFYHDGTMHCLLIMNQRRMST